MIKLVRATKEDVSRVSGFMEVFYAIDDYPFDKEQAQQNLSEFLENDQLGVLWMVMSNDQGVGYLALTFGYSFEYGGRDAFIDEFYLRDEARGKGIGSEVMNLLELEAPGFGLKAVHLEVEVSNKIANKLYIKSGYTTNGRTLMTRRME